MNPEDIFQLANTLFIIGWALIIFTPGWKYTLFSVKTLLIPILLAVVYFILILSRFFCCGLSGEISSLAEVRVLFGDDFLLVAGWIHYLAFDLFAGSWMLTDAKKLTIRQYLVVPCLLLTCLLGPVGLLVYLFVRFYFTKKWEPLAD